MLNEKWLNLQLFADGAGGSASAGAGSGTATGEGGNTATTGDNATAAAEQKLRELGVPESKIRKRASKVASRLAAQNAQTTHPVVSKVTSEPITEEAKEQSAPAKSTPPEETKTPATTRMSWDEIMADPEYNKQMQSTVQARLKGAKGAEETLAKLTPALELLARKHNLDPANMDYDALAKAIGDDNSYYEEKAIEMGVPVETAKKIDQQERKEAREKIQMEKTLQQQKFHDHIQRLEKQGEDMKKIFPSFDLKTELKNPTFLRLTSPGVGLSVEDAYHAVHRKEIQSAAMKVVAEKTAQKISNDIQSGRRRPDEAGTSSQAPSETTFNYRTASKEQREALKQRIRAAAARGEKLYPGQ